jgi:hypothetical protein
MIFSLFSHLPNKRLIYLLLSIVMFLGINPFFHEVGRAWVSVLFAGLLIPFLAVWLVAEHRFNMFIATALAVPLVILSWVSRFDPTDIIIIFRYLIAVAFYGFAVYLVLHNIHKREVTVDVVVGSISAYLLIGIMWAFLYQLINVFSPGSFLSTIAADTGNGTIDFFYYSFTTMTTLGIGDIVPISAIARSFTALESVTGVLFTAIVIGRIIGLYVAKKGGVFSDVVDALKK